MWKLWMGKKLKSKVRTLVRMTLYPTDFIISSNPAKHAGSFWLKIGMTTCAIVAAQRTASNGLVQSMPHSNILPPKYFHFRHSFWKTIMSQRQSFFFLNNLKLWSCTLNGSTRIFGVKILSIFFCCYISGRKLFQGNIFWSIINFVCNIISSW